jgi:hypothetical protein
MDSEYPAVPPNTVERCWCDESAYRPHPQVDPYHPGAVVGQTWAEVSDNDD